MTTRHGRSLFLTVNSATRSTSKLCSSDYYCKGLVRTGCAAELPAFDMGVGNLFTITGRVTGGLSLSGRKKQVILSKNSNSILLWGIEASLDIVSKCLLIMELRFDEILRSMLGNENSDAGQFKCSLRPHLARGFPTPALTQQKPFAIWSFKHWRLKRFYFLRSYSGSFSFTSVLYQQTTSFCLQLKSVVIFWKKTNWDVNLLARWIPF